MALVTVTGGTGTLGSAVVTRLLARQHRVRVLSRRADAACADGVEVVTGDMLTGAGIQEAVAGADAIIHCASGPANAQQVDVEGTRTLLNAARASGAPHIIYSSIVGIDRSTMPYYQAKYATEGVIEQSGLPWTNVRIVQFHNFVLRMVQAAGADTQPEVTVNEGIRFQSIDVGEAADQLVALVDAGPAGLAPDVGGPEVLTLAEMVATYLRVRGRQATVRPVAEETPTPFSTGINLVPDHAVGKITWEAFLRAYAFGDA